jgi:nucleotide-binding universal stress UspA family protein
MSGSFLPMSVTSMRTSLGSEEGRGRNRGARSIARREGRVSITELAVKAAPTWKGIVATAEERNASLIVLGSHRRRVVVGHLLGSVAAAVVTHSAASVLVVHSD